MMEIRAVLVTVFVLNMTVGFVLANTVMMLIGITAGLAMLLVGARP